MAPEGDRAHYGISLAAIADAGFQMYPLADEENAVLATAPDKSGIVRPTPLYDWLYELAGDVKPVMIGIASSANVFAGNENVRTEVQQFIRLLRRIACVAHGTVLLVTQPSLTGIENKSASHEGLAGTTQWHNAVRARAVMKAVKPEDGDRHRAARDHVPQEPIRAGERHLLRALRGWLVPAGRGHVDRRRRAGRQG